MSSTRNTALAASLGALTLLGMAPAHATINLVADGNFDNPAAGASYASFYEGNSFGNASATGSDGKGDGKAWVVVPSLAAMGGLSGIDEINGLFSPSPPGGGNSVDLSGTDPNYYINGSTNPEPGAIEQTLSTTAGTTYNLSFALSGNPDGGGTPSTKMMDLIIGGGTALHYSYALPSNANDSNLDWIVETTSFVATGPSTTLEFSDADVPESDYGALIGNINVNASPAPEPSQVGMLALLGLGLGGLILKARKRNAAAL